LGTWCALPLAIVVGGAGAALGAGDRPRPEANLTGSGTKFTGLAGAALLGVAVVVLGKLAGGEVCWAGPAVPLLGRTSSAEESAFFGFQMKTMDPT